MFRGTIASPSPHFTKVIYTPGSAWGKVHSNLLTRLATLLALQARLQWLCMTGQRMQPCLCTIHLRVTIGTLQRRSQPLYKEGFFLHEVCMAYTYTPHQTQIAYAMGFTRATRTSPQSRIRGGKGLPRLSRREKKDIGLCTKIMLMM